MQTDTDEKYLHEELTYKIIGILIKVHNTLGCGFPERIYQRAVVEDLKREDLKVEIEKEIEIVYHAKVIGKYKLDLVVEDKIILELKAATTTAKIFKDQLISYLKGTSYQVGILANFGTPKLEYFRLFRAK
ncbi:GxxExxY protein [bacterium]|nr:GxxExxY protein [bacterium]MBU4561579.1 GxxExxY protein [bacterium]MCG2676119.1 GxxExxY protein [bacterium]MCG2678129.1 GxxExxY protein [bacterium]